jgi:hypothetical protein
MSRFLLSVMVSSRSVYRNELHRLPSRMFDTLKELEFLYRILYRFSHDFREISDNLLTWIPGDLTHRFPKLSELFVNRNPWRCRVDSEAFSSYSHLALCPSTSPL